MPGHAGFRRQLVDLLVDRGALTLEHPGGTLLAHLQRVEGLCRSLCPDDEVLAAAALAHAAYGTDGFDVALWGQAERGLLRRVIGTPAEELVYRYCACDRARTWPALAASATIYSRWGPVAPSAVRAAWKLTGVDLERFVTLSVVNELDVIEQSPELMARHGPGLARRWESWAPLGIAATTHGTATLQAVS